MQLVDLNVGIVYHIVSSFHVLNSLMISKSRSDFIDDQFE